MTHFLTMTRAAILMLAPLHATAASAQTSQAAADCKSISDAAARLACFDKKPSVPATKTQAAPRATPGAIVDGAWELRIKKDSFSDKTSCVISPIGKPNVQITVGHLYISYAGQGGVAGFTPRFDDMPPQGMQLPSPIDQQIGAVHFEGDKFYQAMAASRLRVQTLTILRQLKDEDLQLESAKRLYKKIPAACE